VGSGILPFGRVDPNVVEIRRPGARVDVPAKGNPAFREVPDIIARIGNDRNKLNLAAGALKKQRR